MYNKMACIVRKDKHFEVQKDDVKLQKIDIRFGYGSDADDGYDLCI